MVPSYFTQLETFPKTPNGKTDFKNLPDPEIDVDEFIKPRSDIEKELFDMIDNEELPRIKDEVACYKLACYCMGYGVEEFKYYRNKLYQWHGSVVYPWTKLLGSSRLFRAVEVLLKESARKFGGSLQYRNYIKNKVKVDEA